jgi:antitoxin component of RelBE/YafQ-DinJ toxin-antitoxin module
LPSGASDIDVAEMLYETTGNPNFLDLDTLSIEQRMLSASIRKHSINKDLEIILKNCSIDANLNKNGNLIRLEEHVSPLNNGMYQIYYKNPSNLRMYIRDGIPETVTFAQVYSREFSYPRKDLPVVFVEAGADNTGILKPYEDDPEILDESKVNKDLITPEDVIPWDSNKTFDELEIKDELKKNLLRVTNNYNMLPEIRRKIFNEKGIERINFPPDQSALIKNSKLIKSIKELAKENVSSALKKDIAETFTNKSKKQKLNTAVLELVYKYNLYTEDHIQQLLEIGSTDPQSIFNTLKEAKSKK